MKPPKEKRIEYWNHFMARYFVEKAGGGNGITGPRLLKIKPIILADNDFWFDIIDRHNGLEKAPEQMREDNAENYNHCLGNFWGMINQEMAARGIVK